MAVGRPPSPAIDILRGSGLDTSSGPEFIQQRIALFAKMIGLISLSFLLISVVVAIAVGHTGPKNFPEHVFIGHTAGMVFIAAIWLVCRRGRLPLLALEILDAAALVGSCTAWAFFITPRIVVSIFGGVVSVVLTLLTRAILVPSKATRTLRLSVLGVLPLLLMMGLWLRGVGAVDDQPPVVTIVYQILLTIAGIALATLTSRVIYDLHKRVQEANELGPYTLEEKLGEGGMGEVWRARHRFLARSAAVKLIRAEPLLSGRTDPDLLLRRFEREARATAALRSPHTVQLYDFGQADDGTLFYVMELLVGVDLEQLIARFGPVPAERAIHILKQVCHSLDEAHENGLIHRDVKPANIFVTGIGCELDFVKVLDFGLVRLRQERSSPEQQKLTAEGSVGGTPAYMAPEVALGEEKYDHRIDIYAVGCIGYWLLTGALVFDANTAMKMMLDHADTPPRRPQTRTELVIPADLEQIIMDCLEKDPAGRPASAGLLATRLADCELPENWTRERAQSWWATHLPQTSTARPVADVLLSREGAATGARILKPKRERRIG